MLGLSDDRSLDKMAYKYLEHTFPILPNELLIIIICSFTWTGGIDQIRFLWEQLRLVSSMFKEVVEEIFAKKDISKPTALLRLLSTAMVTLHESGKFSL